LPASTRCRQGAINHALRVTVSRSRKAYLPPATHWAASETLDSLPPMGMRLRLKASYSIPSGFSEQTKVILRTLKKFGMIVADNGSDWFISGAQRGLGQRRARGRAAPGPRGPIRGGANGRPRHAVTGRLLLLLLLLLLVLVLLRRLAWPQKIVIVVGLGASAKQSIHFDQCHQIAS
jgi:hypothetical protein